MSTQARQAQPRNYNKVRDLTVKCDVPKLPIIFNAFNIMDGKGKTVKRQPNRIFICCLISFVKNCK